MQKKKLVLVLDLDNTLIHSIPFQMKPEFFRINGAQGKFCIDKLKSEYHIWGQTFSYKVKIRPFLKEFIKEVMQMYEIYFYTAATRNYGDYILEILKLEIISVINVKQLEITFDPKRLISRDDKARFTEQNNTEIKERDLEIFREAERRAMANGAQFLCREMIENQKLNYI